MFEAQQIYQSKIDITVGGSSISGFPVTFNIMSQNLSYEPVFWDTGTRDVALSGKKRSNIRGYDLYVTLDYETSLEPDKIETILDGLVFAKNSNYVVRFYPDASDNTNSFVVIPSDGNSFFTNYEDTVQKGQIPTLSLENETILTQVSGDGTSPVDDDVDAETLDGLDSTQFLRSDVSDSFNGATLDLLADVYLREDVYGNGSNPISFQSNLDMNSNRIENVGVPQENSDVANKGYVDATINGLDWQESVISWQDSPPASPSEGDRYLVSSGQGDWSGQDDNVAIYEDGAWTFVSVDDATTLEIEDVGLIYIYNGTTWVRFGSAISHNQLQDLDASDHLLNGVDTGLSFYDSSADEFDTSSELTFDGTDFTAPNLNIGTTGHGFDSSGNADINDAVFSRDGVGIVEIIANDALGGIVGTDTDHNLNLRRNNTSKISLLSDRTRFLGSSFNIDIGAGSNSTAGNEISFSRAGLNYISVPTNGTLVLSEGSNNVASFSNNGVNLNYDTTVIDSNLYINDTATTEVNLRIFGAGAQSVFRPNEDGNADFKFDGTQWVVETDLTAEANLFVDVNADILGTTTTNVLDVATTSTFGGASTFEADIQSDGAVSRVSGWQGDVDGNWDFRSIFSDSLVVKAFTADVAQAFRGSRFLTKSFATIKEDFTIPAVSSSATLTVAEIDGFSGLEVFEQNDYILLNIINQTDGLVVGEAWGEITSTITDNGDGTQSFTFTTRNVSEAEIVGESANEGSEALSFGSASSPKGFIHDTVLDNLGSPYSQVVTWTTNPWNRSNWTVRTRTGNLAGITNASGFGFYGENSYLTGSLLAGDLTEAGNFLKYDAGSFTGVFDSLDFDSDTFVLTAGDMVIDSTNGIELTTQGDYWRNDGEFRFGGASGINYDGTQITMGSNVLVDGADVSVTSLPRVSDEGLVRHYKFDEGSGTTLIDSTGNADIDLLEGSFVQGISGTGIEKTIFSDIAVIPDSPDVSFDHTTPFTISIWARIDEVDDAGGENTTGILLKGSTVDSCGIDWVFTTGTIRATLRDASNEYRVSVSADSSFVGNIHHYIMKYSADDNEIELWIDGEFKGTADTTGLGDFSDNTLGWEILGNLVTGGNGASSKGFADEVRIYNRTLSEREIKSLYLYPSGNSGGLISANTVRTGVLQSSNFTSIDGNFTDAGTYFDLDNGNLYSEQFGIVGGSAYFKGTLSAPDGDIGGFDIGSELLSTSFSNGNVYISSDESSAVASAGLSIYMNAEDMPNGDAFSLARMGKIGALDEKVIVNATYGIQIGVGGDDVTQTPYRDLFRVDSNGFYLTNPNGDYTIDSDGIQFADTESYEDSKGLVWGDGFAKVRARESSGGNAFLEMFSNDDISLNYAGGYLNLGNSISEWRFSNDWINLSGGLVRIVADFGTIAEFEQQKTTLNNDVVLPDLPTSDPNEADKLYTQTAFELGGSGSTRVVCVSDG